MLQLCPYTRPAFTFPTNRKLSLRKCLFQLCPFGGVWQPGRVEGALHLRQQVLLQHDEDDADNGNGYEDTDVDEDDNGSIGDNVNVQVLRGHCGNPGRVTDGSKTWPRPQAQVPRNVRLSTTPLLVLSEPPLTDGACFYLLFVSTPEDV